MQTKMEMEVGTALGIAQSMMQSIEMLERWYPPSKRGSNAQRALDDIKMKRDIIEQCLLDAQK